MPDDMDRVAVLVERERVALVRNVTHRRRHHSQTGRCGRCGVVIPQARLGAVAGAVFCLACQKIFEESHGRDH